jgi:hypothetical protein
LVHPLPSGAQAFSGFAAGLENFWFILGRQVFLMKITKPREVPLAGGMLFSGLYATKYAVTYMLTGICSFLLLPDRHQMVES